MKPPNIPKCENDDETGASGKYFRVEVISPGSRNLLCRSHCVLGDYASKSFF